MISINMDLVLDFNEFYRKSYKDFNFMDLSLEVELIGSTASSNLCFPKTLKGEELESIPRRAVDPGYKHP